MTATQGAKDPIVLLPSVQDYYRAALKQGDRVSLVVIQEAGHYELVIPLTFAWPEVRKAFAPLIQ